MYCTIILQLVRNNYNSTLHIPDKWNGGIVCSWFFCNCLRAKLKDRFIKIYLQTMINGSGQCRVTNHWRWCCPLCWKDFWKWWEIFFFFDHSVGRTFGNAKKFFSWTFYFLSPFDWKNFWKWEDFILFLSFFFCYLKKLKIFQDERKQMVTIRVI